MPGVNTESIHDDYLSLGAYQDKDGNWQVAAVDVLKTLNTHIVGREGQYLIPIQMLLSLQSTSEILDNVYFDYRNHQPEMARLSPGEMERLFNHSPITLAIYDALKSYELYVEDKNCLLGPLRHLSTMLYINSARGIGQSKNAGSTIYAAIICI